MSKINIKTDFKNGEKLLDTQLNNNFKTIAAAFNNNDDILSANIATAKAALKSELDQITQNRGWDWSGDGSPRVSYVRRATTTELDSVPVQDGQILLSGEGANYVDYKLQRLGIGGPADGSMSDTSQNAIQNKVVKSYIDERNVKREYTRVATDLNNLMITGNYSTLTTTTNIPVSNVKGYLWVLSAGSEAKQIWIQADSGRIFIRHLLSDQTVAGGTPVWSAWTELATLTETESKYQKKISSGTTLPTTGSEGDIFIKY